MKLIDHQKMGVQPLDITDFGFRGLGVIQIFDKEIEFNQNNGFCRCAIACSSRYGIIVIASSTNRTLISLCSSEVHKTEATKDDLKYKKLKEGALSNVKVTDLSITEGEELVALGSNCAGRIMSALVSTRNGPFVHLYDFCALSPGFQNAAGVVQTIRISSADNAKGIALEWNPTIENVFSVIASDGALSTFCVDIENPMKMSIIGTTKLAVLGTCMSWSPKGKQLVVGDLSGNVLQYKPEMALVRRMPPPIDVPSFQGAQLRCVGICWLSTTEFLIAYSPFGSENFVVSMLCVRKEGPPVWTHFEESVYCSDYAVFPQSVSFVPLLQWHIVLCASSRVSEVAVFGKRMNEWKCWTMEDVSRLELPVWDRKESFPVGVCLDFSSQIPVKIGSGKGDSISHLPPCPIVLVISSQGQLLPFNILSLREEHQNLNITPEVIPTKIQVGTVPAKEKQKDTTNSVGDTPVPKVHSEQPISSQQHVSLSAVQSSLTTTRQPLSSSFAAAPAVQSRMPGSSGSAKPTSSSVPIESKPPNRMITPPLMEPNIVSSSVNKEELTKLRLDLKRKLAIFDSKITEMREVNDWMGDLKCSVEKHGVPQSKQWDGEEEEDLEEVEKMRCEVQDWLEKAENVVRDSLSSVKERQECVIGDQDNLLHSPSARMLDFNNCYRMNKLAASFQQLDQKIMGVERSLAKMSLSKGPSSLQFRDITGLSPEEEQKVCIAARNVCRAIAARRNDITDLYQKYTTLNSSHKSSVSARSPESPPKAPVTVTPLRSERMSVVSEISPVSPDQFSVRRNRLIDLLSRRVDMVASPSKPNVLSLSLNTRKKVPKQIAPVAHLESRLLRSITAPIRATSKKLMDIGTQSPAFLSGKELVKAETPSGPPQQAVLAPKIETKPLLFNASVKGVSAAINRPEQGNVITKVASNVAPNGNVSVASTLPITSTSTVVKSTTGIIQEPLVLSKGRTEQVSKSTGSAATQPSQQPQPAAASSTKYTPVTTAGTVPPNAPVSTKQLPAFASLFSKKEQLKTEIESPPSTIPQQAESASAPTTSVVNSVVNTTASSSSAVPAGLDQIVKSDYPESAIIPAMPAASVALPTTAAATTTSQPVSSSPVTFTFALPSTTPKMNAPPSMPSSPSIADSSPPVSATASSFIPPPVTASQSTVDEGMMDEEGPGASTSNLFSSSLSLGSGPPISTTPKNVFGGGLKLGAASPASSSLFGGLAKPPTSSVFGGGSPVQGTASSLFGGGATSAAAASATPSFSFSSALTQPQQQNPSSLFGAKPFGGGTSSFGGAPTFGSKPTFGAGSPMSVFGQAKPTQPPPPSATSGFSAFARGGSVGFGTLASAQQPQSTGSVFGGSGFGAVASKGGSSVFGGGMSSQTASGGSSFSTWR